jgi:hypothetical protein
MESSRIRTIINLYAELKAKSERFKDVEPCFVEGNEYLARLWTTANAEGGSGTENPEDIDIPVVAGTGQGTEDGGQQTGTVIGADGKPIKGQGKGKGEGKEGGEDEGGEGEGGEGGEGEGKDGKGKGKGKGKKGKDGKGGEKGEGEGEGDGEGDEEDGEGDGKGKGKEKDNKKKTFKVGDKVRVKETGDVGEITKVNPDGTYEIG